jgi:transposase
LEVSFLAESIAKHKNKTPNKDYYYYQHTYREKINPNHSGKIKGTGKSKVITESVYLGTARDILEAIKGSRSKYYKAKEKSFGLPLALWEIANQIKLPEIIDKNVNKNKGKYPISKHLIIAAINRVCDVEPKDAFPEWLPKTSLPFNLRIDPQLFNSQNYWNNYELVVSEKEAKKQRERIKSIKNKKQREKAELKYLADTVINKIEEEIVYVLYKQEGVNLDYILYDPTNFYTYIDKLTESFYAECGRNKSGKNNLQQLTLATGITEDGGLPILHLLYKGNLPDVKLFPDAITVLVKRLEKYHKEIENISIVFDKGNNSDSNLNNKENREYLNKDYINLIGSLKPSEYKEFLKKKAENYPEDYKGEKFYTFTKNIYGGDKLIVVKYNESTHKRQKLTFESGIKKLTEKIRNYFNSLKTKDKQEIKKLEELVNKFISKQRLGNFIDFEIIEEKGGRDIKIYKRRSKVIEKHQQFGKTILFTDNLNMSSQQLIDKYKNISIINEDHRILNGVVKFRPLWHWTDSKIRVQAFVNVLGLLLIKLLEYRLKHSDFNIKMNALAIKNTLSDIKEVILVDKKRRSINTLTELTTNQNLLFKLFNLQKYAPKDWEELN